MKELPLNALRAFAAIHSNRGVRAAARELGIAHSSVSRHLAELEAWLGVELVAGSARGSTTFTPQGDMLGNAVVGGLRDIERAVDAVREARTPNAVTISTTSSIAVRWLLPRLVALEQAHRTLEISVVVEQRLEDLNAGTVDISIRMGRGGWPGVRARPLMDDVLFPVMSPAFHATSKRPRRPEDLIGLRLLHDRDPNASWDAWRSVHGPRVLDVRRGPRFASSDLVLRAAAQGLGVALARGRLARDDLAVGTLLRPIAGLEVRLDVAYWIALPDREPRRAAAAVIAWLEREAAPRLGSGPS
jgi:LysR family transcriptional regulator, glycine cleavage system transcriptional activator